MRVIACGPGYHGKYRDLYYSFDKKIINGLIRIGHSVIPFSDRQITRSMGGVRVLGKIAAERQLLNLAYSYVPDAILLLQADQVPNSALLAIKKQYPNCRIVNIDCDLIVSEREARIRSRRGVVDVTLITSAGFPLEHLRRDGFRAGFIPNPTDASIEDANVYADADKFFDLIYISGALKSSPRWVLLDSIVRQAPDLKVGSFGANKQRVFGQDYFNVLKQSRCALNWSARNDIRLYSSDRIAQLFGAGACVCMPRQSGYDQFLSDKEALFFSDADELIAKVRGTTSTPEWKEIARAGQERYRTLFNEMRVARYVMDFLFDGTMDDYEWSGI